MHRVPTSCLERFAPRDFAFIESVLLGERPEQRGHLQSLFDDPDSLVSVLEDERLFRAVIEMPYPISISPELYFFVLVRRNLAQAGIGDVHIADYVAATLAGHAVGHPMSGLPSRPEADFTYHVDFLEAMEGLSDYDRFFLQVQCGNHFLVLTGLFPKFLEHRSSRRGAPRVGYYEAVARNAFLSAGEHPLAEEFELRSLYPRLADRLQETRHALNRMAEDYLFLGT